MILEAEVVRVLCIGVTVFHISYDVWSLQSVILASQCSCDASSGGRSSACYSLTSSPPAALQGKLRNWLPCFPRQPCGHRQSFILIQGNFSSLVLDFRPVRSNPLHTAWCHLLSEHVHHGPRVYVLIPLYTQSSLGQDQASLVFLDLAQKQALGTYFVVLVAWVRDWMNTWSHIEGVSAGWMAEEHPSLTPSLKALISRGPAETYSISRNLQEPGKLQKSWHPQDMHFFIDGNLLEGPDDPGAESTGGKPAPGTEPLPTGFPSALRVWSCVRNIWKGILIKIQPGTTLEEADDLLSDTVWNFFCLFCTARLQRI